MPRSPSKKFEPSNWSPRNKTEATMLPAYRSWSTSKRVVKAAERCLAEPDESVSQIARNYGVTRQAVTKKRNELAAAQGLEVGPSKFSPKRTSDEKASDAARKLGVAVRVENERRRVPEDFFEFSDLYFSGWACPDCDDEHGDPIVHDTPEFQREIMAAAYDPEVRRLLINMPPYHGKVLGSETLIPTPSGWTTMGDIQPGDELFDKDGRVTRVKWKSAEQPTPWRVQVGGPNGPEFWTDGPHRWWVEPRDAKPRFVTTTEIAEASEARRFRVPVSPGFDGGFVETPVDPYVLGAWLGDGDSAGGRFTAHEDDQPFLRGEIAAAGYETTDHAHPQNFGVPYLKTGLTILGVVGDKHIPAGLLRASRHQRLALLQGLMDTDGTVDVSAGRIASFTNTNRNLVDGVQELAASLGWKTRMYERKTAGKPAWVVTFCPTRDRSPFRMPRKTELLPETRERVSHWPFTHVADERGEGSGFCIAVSSDTETFLVGREMVPTGNSTLVSVRRTVHKIVSDPNYRLLLVSETEGFAKNLLQAITQILTDPDLYIHSPRNLVEDWGPFKGTQPWNSNHIFVAGRETAEKDPTVQALGIGSQIYGRRADEIVFDDIVSTKRSQSSETIEKDLEWIDKMALSRIGKKGRALWVGTRVGPGDLYSLLQQRQTYKVIKYPCIIDESNEVTMWPEHFPFSQALIQRDEMTAADFQLVYQQVEMPGAGAAFTEEMVERCKDSERSWGHYEPGWRLVAGLDPAGANQWSGFTAMMLLGVDPSTGKRYLVDLVNIKQMKAPQIFDQMKRWSADYPLSEWRVENNGLQSQLFQYNHEIQQELIGLYGTRVVPHNTQGSNKWDPVFGVESMAPLFQNRMMSIPWANTQSRQKFQPLIEQLLSFPTGAVSDLVMCTWFADLAARDLLRRDSLPMFNDRMKVPGRVKKRRHVVDFASQQVRGVPLADQRPGHLQGGGRRQRRMTSDRIKEHAQVEEFDAPEGPSFVNV